MLLLPAHRIRRLQSRLAELGMYRGKIDGIFGPKTLDALRGFQKINGLVPDGILGRLTIEELWPTIIAGGRREAEPVIRQAWPWPSEKNVPKFYGERGKNLVSFKPPYKMVLAWDVTEPVRSFQVHARVLESVKQAYDLIAKAYPSETVRRNLRLDRFGGCFSPRKKRGGTGWSMHSWAIAIDTDPEFNQLKWDHTRASLARSAYDPFFAAWERVGWSSLGKKRDFDWMHVQATLL